LAFRGCVDEANRFAIRGWVTCDTFSSLTPFVDIVVNRRCLGSVRAGLFREDLVALEFSDGYRAFSFNPFENLQPGCNLLEVFVSGSDQILTNGSREIFVDLSDDLRPKCATNNALTMAGFMTSSAFVDQVDLFFRFQPFSSVLEIDPTYGRVFKTVLERGYPFREYVGLDRSRERAEQLKAGLVDKSRGIRFEQGDCETYRGLETGFDIVLWSGTSEYQFGYFCPTPRKGLIGYSGRSSSASCRERSQKSLF